MKKEIRIGFGAEPKKKYPSQFRNQRVEEEAFEALSLWMEEGTYRCQMEYCSKIRCTGCSLSIIFGISAAQKEEANNKIHILYHEKPELASASEIFANLIKANWTAERPDDLIEMSKARGVLLNCHELKTEASLLIRLETGFLKKEKQEEIRDSFLLRQYAEIMLRSICQFLELPYIVNEPERFTIQVGAYCLITNAIYVRNRLIHFGFEDACIRKGKLNGADIYRVQTGNFKKFENAQILARQIRSNKFYAVIREKV